MNVNNSMDSDNTKTAPTAAASIVVADAARMAASAAPAPPDDDDSEREDSDEGAAIEKRVASEERDSELDEEMDKKETPVGPSLNSRADEKLFNCLHSVDGSKLDESERNLTDEDIMKLSLDHSRKLCKKCSYYITKISKTKTSTLPRPNLSTSGSKDELHGRLLAWFFVYRRDRHLDPTREQDDSGIFKEADDARLQQNPIHRCNNGCFSCGWRRCRSRSVGDMAPGRRLHFQQAV